MTLFASRHQGLLTIAVMLTALGGTASAQSITQFGVQHQALGNATLSLAGSDIVVAGIGGALNDGVECVVAASGHQADLGALDSNDTLPIGAAMEWECVGTALPAYTGTLSRLRMTKVAPRATGAAYELSADFTSLGVTTGVVEFYLDGQLQGAEACTFSSWRGFFEDCWHDLEGGLTGAELTGGHPLGILVGAAVGTYLGSAQVVTTNGGSYVCDAVRVGYLAPGPQITGQTSTRIRAANIPSFRLTQERLFHLGNAHSATGPAQWSSTPTSLICTRTGTGPVDIESTNYWGRLETGVAFDLAPVDPANTAPIGSLLRAGARGSQNGVPGTYLGDSTVTKVSNGINPGYQVTFDYTPVGATSARIEVYSQGSLVGTSPNHTGPVTLVSTMPIGCGKRLWDPTRPLWCIWWDFPQGTLIPIPGVGTFIGDEMRILADNTVGAIGGLDAFELRVDGFAALTMTGVTTMGPSPDVIGTGCVGTAGIPQHRSIGQPRIGSIATWVSTNLPPFTFAAQIIGFTEFNPGIDLGIIGMPGCRSYVSFDMMSLTAASGNVAIHTAPVPNNPAIVGIVFLSQCAAYDPSVNAFGWTASNAVRNTILQ